MCCKPSSLADYQCQAQAAPRLSAREAATKLSGLMSRNLDVHPDPVALRLFLRLHKSKISMLVDAIHADTAD